MYEEVIMVTVVSALLGLFAGLLMRPATEMAKVLGERGLAMLQGKAKRSPGKPRKKRAVKDKAAQEPAASRRQPKIVPAEPTASVTVGGDTKPKKKVGRPSKAELARRAALEQEKAKSVAEQVAHPTTVQATTEPVATPPELISGQLQEIAVYAVDENFARQTDTLENASST